MYQERAAIMEYDGGLTRAEAEAAARSICIKPTQINSESTQNASLRNSANRPSGPGYEAFKAVLKRGGKA